MNPQLETPSPADQKRPGGLIDVGFRIVVTNPDGTIASEQCKEGGDLATNNFGEWLALMFSGTYGIFQNSATDTGAVSRTLAAAVANTTSAGIRIAIGDGNGSTVTPARTDTNLVDTTATGTPGEAAYSGGVITVAHAFVNGSGSAWTGATAIREVGILGAWYDSSAQLRTFLLFHDAIAATTVNNGQTITVTYTITLP